MSVRPFCRFIVAVMALLASPQLFGSFTFQGRLKAAPTTSQGRLPPSRVALRWPGKPSLASAAAQGSVKAAPATTAASAAARPRIVFLGDSLTAGYGLARPQAESVPSLIQARLDAKGYRYEVINAGVSGDTSAGGLSRLNWSLDGDVQVLVIELGANDGLRGLPVIAMKQNLDQIITRAKQRQVKVLLTGMEAPPNYGAAYTKEFRQVFADLAREHKVPFVPFYLQGVAGNPSLNISDGIHPNATGARIVEGTIWRALEPLLVRPR
jgi:acyl-CoA thioesterase-1